MLGIFCIPTDVNASFVTNLPLRNIFRKTSRSQSKAVYLKNSEDLHYEQLSVAQASGFMDVGSPAAHWDLPRSLKGLHFRQETKVKKVMKTIPKTEL